MRGIIIIVIIILTACAVSCKTHVSNFKSVEISGVYGAKTDSFLRFDTREHLHAYASDSVLKTLPNILRYNAERDTIIGLWSGLYSIFGTLIEYDYSILISSLDTVRTEYKYYRPAGIQLPPILKSYHSKLKYRNKFEKVFNEAVFGWDLTCLSKLLRDDPPINIEPTMGKIMLKRLIIENGTLKEIDIIDFRTPVLPFHDGVLQQKNKYQDCSAFPPIILPYRR